jgi:hypothetical protein
MEGVAVCDQMVSFDSAPGVFVISFACILLSIRFFRTV